MCTENFSKKFIASFQSVGRWAVLCHGVLAHSLVLGHGPAVVRLEVAVATPVGKLAEVDVFVLHGLGGVLEHLAAHLARVTSLLPVHVLLVPAEYAAGHEHLAALLALVPTQNRALGYIISDRVQR